ncbi:MAG: hypothetical protein AB8H03_09040 [Saprospiraceae bacterium]
MKKMSKKSLKDFQNGKRVKTLMMDQKVRVKGGIVIDDLNGI